MVLLIFTNVEVKTEMKWLAQSYRELVGREMRKPGDSAFQRAETISIIFV